MYYEEALQKWALLKIENSLDRMEMVAAKVEDVTVKLNYNEASKCCCQEENCSWNTEGFPAVQVSAKVTLAESYRNTVPAGSVLPNCSVQPAYKDVAEFLKDVCDVAGGTITSDSTPSTEHHPSESKEKP